MNTKKFGKIGEDACVDFLRKKGYEIVCQNWTKYHLEIDIIAKKDNLLVIIEVKTRTSDNYGDPQEFVNKKKQSNLVKAAQLYAEENNIENEIQFDIIAVISENGNLKIEHIPDAFYPLIGM